MTDSHPVFICHNNKMGLLSSQLKLQLDVENVYISVINCCTEIHKHGDDDKLL